MSKDQALVLLGMSSKHRRKVSELKRKEVTRHLKLRKIELNRKRKERPKPQLEEKEEHERVSSLAEEEIKVSAGKC